ncbi:hypothetical protein [Streptomyces sp. NPDC019937]|uniref:hypothetical protein n=1 Tax=Streptomyces sp. NPDC019937 TaxID=3154787 RepID=UPI0033CFBA17
MSTQITDRPPTEITAFRRECNARRHNELEFEGTANLRDLPKGSYQAEADAVHVMSTDIDVLAAWLYEMGGTVTTTDTGHGVTVWTLHTRTDVDPGRVACPVRVSVPLVTGSPVMHEIAAAVAA